MNGPFLALLFLGSVLMTGCTCSNEKDESSAENDGTGPLVARAVPEELGVKIKLAAGATEPRLVAVVLAEDAKICEQVSAFVGARGHVLCTDEKSEGAEARLKNALVYLKKEYGAYVAGPPVWFFTDRARSEVGFRLVLKEPSFFSHSYLPGLDEKALTATTLSAFHERGARTLVVTNEGSNRLKLLAEVAARRGMRMAFVDASEKGLNMALEAISKADERFSGPKNQVPATN